VSAAGIVERARAYLADVRAGHVSFADEGIAVSMLLAGFLADVLDVLDSGGAGLADTGLGGEEPYCTTCGEWAGLFIGMEGWRHYRGDPSPGGTRTLHSPVPGHEPVIGWRRPPVLTTAQLGTMLGALDDAAAARMDRAAAWCDDCRAAPDECCEGHAGDLDVADAYRQVARELRAAGGLR
jgi:hypothetical protein